MGERGRRRKTAFYVLATVIVAVSLGELYALFHWGRGSALDKVSALAALLGFYGIGLGFFTGSEQLARFREIAAGLTDPNPVVYFSSNMVFCGLLAMFGSLGLQSRMEPGAPRGLWLIGLIVWLPLGLLLILYVLFHAAVITFLAYVPLVIAAAVIVRIRYGAGDVEVSSGETRVRLKDVVRHDEAALRGYLMGVPALALSLITGLADILP
jgi:hypothetical protein